MREQLIQYVELLFAGAADCDDIRQEILQNTLDRYDDLIAEGKVPQAAYRMAITGIGDLSDILGTAAPAPAAVSSAAAAPAKKDTDTPRKKRLRAIAIGLYIFCPVPLIVLSEIGMSTLGLCGLLLIVAIATMLLILNGKDETQEEPKKAPLSPENQLRKSIDGIIWAIGLTLYFLVSFYTRAWYITWLIFPITGAIKGLVFAILDLKEAGTHEN